SNYAFARVSNAPTTVGDYEYWNSFGVNDIIPAYDVYVVAHPSADPIILAHADMLYSYLSNGDDGICLVYGNENDYDILDCIGDWDGDPGSGWEVAGVDNATQNHTLIRKPHVLYGASYNWQFSSGTDAYNSQWIVHELDYFENVGVHSSMISNDLDSTNINVNVLPCGSAILTVNNASSDSTNGGIPSEESRAIYTYEYDLNSTHSYIGENFPYVKVKNGLVIHDHLQGLFLSNLIFSVGNDSILLVNDKPVYQFTGDYYENDTYGNFGSWKLITSNGVETNAPCEVPGCFDFSACNFQGYSANNDICIYPPDGMDCDLQCFEGNMQYIVEAEDFSSNHNSNFQVLDCEGVVLYDFYNDNNSLAYLGESNTSYLNHVYQGCMPVLPAEGLIRFDFEFQGDPSGDTWACMYNYVSIPQIPNPSIYMNDNGCFVPDIQNLPNNWSYDNNTNLFTYRLGSCPIYGCISQDALNYNPEADTDDGSCVMPIFGCMNEGAVNYNPNANVNMACIYAGCTDNSALNFNPNATQDDESCCYSSDDCSDDIEIITGCTDPTAFNFNAQAIEDDGSCIPVVLGCMDFFADNYNANANTNDGCIYYGCTYPNSINYDPTANTDDGSCIDAVYGCTDEDADNYYSEANVDNGQCQYFGCTDQAACNYDASKNADDGTCYYLSLELSSIDNSCSGGSLGQITSNVNGGFGNLSYTWNTGETSEDLFNLSEGEYDLTVSDQNGCTVSESATIYEPSIDAELFSPEICYITVDDNTGFNKIVVNPINHESIGGYVIYKEVLTDTYYPIATLDANILEYVDSTSNPLINSDKYKVNVIDNCLFESEQSDAHRTVHLSMNAGLNNSVNLIWNKYDGFDVSSYMVFRGQSVSNMEFVGFIAGSQNSYTDLNPPAGTSIYQVRVVAPICNSASSNPNASFAQVADTLKSNVVEHDYVEENDDLGVNIIAINPSCESCNDGYIISSAIGGTAPYNYVWSNGVNNLYNGFLNIGNYTIYVFDSNGNTISETITLYAESSVVLGCTDSEATNYDADATEDDGSCEYPVVNNPCDITPSGLFVDNIIHERVAFNWSAPSSAPSYYMIRYRPVGTNGWTVMSAGPQNDVPFTGTSRTRYFMEPGTTYQWNIRARVVDENGATVCQSPWSASHQYTTLPACANLTDLSVNPEANLVYFNASKPIGDWGVWQAKGKIREVGSNNYRYLATTEDSYTNQIKYNFTPSTDYEWHTKAWCTGNVDEDGNSDPQYHSGWGEFSAFTTQDPCDKLPTNLSTSSGNNANTAITMSWDTPTSGQPHHYFLELTNETTGQVFSWNNLAGSSTSKTKYGQSSGDQFKWRIRGACGENGTSWATPFTGYKYYTLGGDRLGNDSQSNSQLTNISVYPNPSRGEFNISFDLESRQNVYISITNYLGEVVFTEELKDQEGQYDKTIDLGNKANGIYMLNITTNNQNINQRIVIQ
ncbi:T9SS type A sorting domain-containing protein, partial [Flavobacteriales bacterium]|nr:T9SS type A sorting domain-containing protein [Flavobacteriales bacterium]